MLESDDEDRHLLRTADFYNGKSVFLTGATGFVGTIILETLLRCCIGIKSIYILIRSKKNEQPETRKQKIFDKKVFEKIKEEDPELLNKVHLISGDGSLPNLGMSEEDRQLLIEEVSFVFHCAAILNFMKPLKFALMHNVFSLNTIIELCRKMKKFEGLVYTSTAYSNSNHLNFRIKEEVYRLPFRSEKFLDALKNEDDEKLQDLYDYCKPDWPNTYTFSKCLAENLIMDTASDLPVAIIRPSIVVSTWKQPIPGYVEENSGLAALGIGCGKGFIKVLYMDPNCLVNMIPVDIVAKTQVLAAWAIGTKRCRSPLVVNCTANEKFEIKISEFIETMIQIVRKYPLPKSFEEFRFITMPNKYLYYVAAAYHHYLPAIVLDMMLKILGKKPRLYSIYRFYDMVIHSLAYFLFNDFKMERNNIEILDKLILPEDRKDFSLDFREASFLDFSLKVPETSPFYDWKIDNKTPLERKRTKYRRHILIQSIQGTFMAILCFLIYWIFSLLFL